MKRKRLDYAKWDCILSKTLLHKHVSTPFLTGCIDLLDIHAVTQPQYWNFNNEQILLCDKGIKWLTVMPDDDWFCLSVLLNESNEIMLWYIDMIEEHGIDPDGVPYYYDLYLDMVIYPDGTILLDDMDELEDALDAKIITQEQYDLAIETSQILTDKLQNNSENLRNYCLQCLELLNQT